MGEIGKDFKYKIIKNFLTKDELELLRNYCSIFHRNNLRDFVPDNVCGADTSKYGDYIMESLLLKKVSLMEKETNKKLFPTYSFWRMYTKYNYLAEHDDRPSCEISVTVNIDADKSWPFFIEEKEINIDKGDAIIYLGCEVKHSRKPFDGDYQAQVFLHYVDQEGKNKNYIYDKRPMLGAKYENN